MIDPLHQLPIVRQAQVLALSRSSTYYTPQPMSDADLALMRIIDRLHLAYPFAGARMLRDLLRLRGFLIGRKHASTLMRKLGIEALYRKPNSSKRHPGHKVYPYLLRGMAIERPNQVWAMDMTYIPMAHGFVYLTAVLDWATRKVLAWRLSNSMAADACVDALEEAISKYGTPEIMNTDQGSQFTGAAFIDMLTAHHIQISMDGKGCWRDNVFVERLWKSIKYEEVYLHAYDSVGHAKTSLTKYITFYNNERPHSSLDGHTPDSVYFTSLPAILAA